MRLRMHGAVTVLAFVVITGLLTAMVAVVVGNTQFGNKAEYRAAFADVSGLEVGSDVRVAGVTVGKVNDLQLQPDRTVVGTFEIKGVQLTEATNATVRYKNLTGDRIIDLTRGSGPEQPLAEDGLIPVARTAPALDLDALFNGFKPLMKGLAPDELNKLSSSLISVFQGQGGNMEQLLGTVSRVTSTLADRDAVIGSVIGNLNSFLGTLDSRRAEFGDLINNLQQVITGLSADRDTIGGSAGHIAQVAGTVSDFVESLRPDFHGATQQIGQVTGNLNQMPEYIGYQLSLIPRVIQLVSRGGAYGSFFNIMACGLRLKTDGPFGPIFSPMIASEAPRCKFQDGKVVR